jgi:hypothetical protein
MRTVAGHNDGLLKGLGSIHLYLNNKMSWSKNKCRAGACAASKALAVKIGSDLMAGQIWWHMVAHFQGAIRGPKAHATTKQNSNSNETNEWIFHKRVMMPNVES